MELYTYYRSTASYRVRIALALKGLDFTALAVNLLVPAGGANRQPDYLAINPQGACRRCVKDEGARSSHRRSSSTWKSVIHSGTAARQGFGRQGS